MDQLLGQIERSLGRAWGDVVEYLREQNTVEDIKTRIEAGDLNGVVVALDDAAAKFAHASNAAFIVSGQKAAASLDDAVDDKLISFDATNYRAVAAMQQNKLNLIRGITADQQQVIRQVLTDGALNRRAPKPIAQTLQDSIGLTPAQEQQVANYRAQLESGDSSDLAAALQRELRDGRYDAAVRRAMAGTEPLSQDRIDTMVSRYRDSYVQLRAETIARTEALRTIHEGTEELYQQAIDNGDVDADILVRTWHAANDGRTRASHRAMDGQTRKMGESFVSGDGNSLDYPGDPSAPPEDVINCRCVVSTRLAS